MRLTTADHFGRWRPYGRIGWRRGMVSVKTPKGIEYYSHGVRIRRDIESSMFKWRAIPRPASKGITFISLKEAARWVVHRVRGAKK